MRQQESKHDDKLALSSDAHPISAEKSPDSSLGHDQPYSNNYYDPDVAHPDAEYDEDLHVQCPSHTTERRLVNKIDFRVIPILSIMYLLAFLDRYAIILRCIRALSGND